MLWSEYRLLGAYRCGFAEFIHNMINSIEGYLDTEYVRHWENLKAAFLQKDYILMITLGVLLKLSGFCDMVCTYNRGGVEWLYQSWKSRILWML